MFNDLHFGYQKETMDAYGKLEVGSLEHDSQKRGIEGYEPLILIADSLLRYAKAFRGRYERPISDYTRIKSGFVAAINGVWRLCYEGIGAIAMEDGSIIDSKESGCIKKVLLTAVKEAGLTKTDLCNFFAA